MLQTLRRNVIDQEFADAPREILQQAQREQTCVGRGPEGVHAANGVTTISLQKGKAYKTLLHAVPTTFFAFSIAPNR